MLRIKSSEIASLGTSDATPVVRPGDETFAQTLKSKVSDVSGMQDGAKDLIARFVRGEPVDVHQVMTAAEEASISLEFLVEMRNKLIDAVRTLTNLQ